MTNFQDFAVGDHISFERVIDLAGYRAFESISADDNPLHHDEAYARRSGYDVAVAPLHLVMAPISAIAGTVFPGEPSLYLGHKVQALKPVLYGDSICYSARITAINSTYRILSIRVLGLRGVEVVLCCDMDVQARSDEWETPSQHAIQPAAGDKTALITGASGDIGQAISRRLARDGWNLILHYRKSREAAQRIADACGEDCAVSLVAGDLETADGCDALASVLEKANNLSLLVHSASPPLDSSLERLLAVQFRALATLCNAVLPSFLMRQAGTVIQIGSTAVSTSPPGWENYVAAKNAATGLLNGLHTSYSKWGARFLTLAPSSVKGAYSEGYRLDDAGVLLPEEVAETVLDMAVHPDQSGNYIELDTQGKRVGDFGFHMPRGPGAAPVSEVAAGAPAESHSVGGQVLVSDDAVVTQISTIVCNVLELAPSTSLAGAGIGTISGWDSLGHIKMMLELERELGIAFSTEEISETLLFDSLVALCLTKLSSRT